MSFNLLAISYAKRALDPASRERARMQAYATRLNQYHVVVFTRQSEGYPAVQQDGNLTLYATNSRTKIGMVLEAIRIGRVIVRDSGQPFVISSQDPFESSFVARRLLTKEHVHQVQIHGDVFNSYSAHTSFLQRIRVWYGKQVVQTAAQVRVVSERVKRSVMQLGVAEENIVVLPIQSNLEPFLAVGMTREVSAHGTLKLSYIGRLAAEKNLALLIQVCAELQRRQLSFTLRLVGDGPECVRLEQMVQTHGLVDVVTFVPWTENPTMEMAQADVFCLTSNHEGWGIVLQEAAAAGLAIVTTDVGCAGEFITDNQTGLVVQVGDTDAFTEALAALQDTDLRERLGRNAYQLASQSSVSESEYVDRWIAAHPKV